MESLSSLSLFSCLMESLSSLNLFSCCILFFLFFILIIVHYFILWVTTSFLCFFQPAIHLIKPVANLIYYILHLWSFFFFNFFISRVRVSLVFSILFFSPVNILMVVALNSPSDMLFISVSPRSLAVALYYSFMWDKFLHLCILSKSLSSSMWSLLSL